MHYDQLIHCDCNIYSGKLFISIDSLFIPHISIVPIVINPLHSILYNHDFHGLAAVVYGLYIY